MENQEDLFLTHKPTFQYLSKEQQEKIHDASLALLENTGADFFLQEAIDLLSGAGARVVSAARVTDYLPHLDFVMAFALAQDVPRRCEDTHHFAAMVANCTKPILFNSWDRAREKTLWILENHEPEPLQKNIADKIKSIVADLETSGKRNLV